MSRSAKSRTLDALATPELSLDMPDTARTYTPDEKAQLLANLDIEVAHKLRQFEAWLADALENFRIHQEGLISRIPKPVRAMTLREFERYGGDVQAALKGLQRQKLGGGPETAEIDRQTRKRKWVASQEADADPKVDGESSRATKNARIAEDTRKPKPGSSTGPGTAQHAHLQSPTKTPRPVAGSRMASVPGSPSPQKPKPTMGTFGRPPPRLASPSKLGTPSQQPDTAPRPTKPPSRATFNPVLPPKTPHYPNPRLPRLNEHMLSMNGSPLANPYGVNRDWFATGDDPDADETTTARKGSNNKKMKPKANTAGKKTVGRANSILVRRDTSVNGFHSRTNSQASLPPSHSESESHSIHPVTPHTNLIPAALIAIPTKDGHLLEFDPLQTSPGALDALQGITDSAKKQAKEDVGRLVRAAVDKWKIK